LAWLTGCPIIISESKKRLGNIDRPGADRLLRSPGQQDASEVVTEDEIDFLMPKVVLVDDRKRIKEIK
jgi:hypothetical protein